MLHQRRGRVNIIVGKVRHKLSWLGVPARLFGAHVAKGRVPFLGGRCASGAEKLGQSQGGGVIA